MSVCGVSEEVKELLAGIGSLLLPHEFWGFGLSGLAEPSVLTLHPCPKTLLSQEEKKLDLVVG